MLKFDNGVVFDMAVVSALCGVTRVCGKQRWLVSVLCCQPFVGSSVGRICLKKCANILMLLCRCFWCSRVHSKPTSR